MEQLVVQTPAVTDTPSECLTLRIRGHELKLQGDWSRVFKPTGSSLALARGIMVKKNDVVFEAGVGCGVNSILAAKLGASKVHGTDVVANALEWARSNAALNGVLDKVDFQHGSLFDPFPAHKFNVAIADLPFAPDMSPTVAKELGMRKELLSALCGGPTGGESTIAFVREAGKRLKPAGRIYFALGELAQTGKVQADLSKDFTLTEVHSTYSYLSIDKPPFVRYLMSKGARLDFSQRRPRFKVSTYEAKPKRR